MRHCFMPGEQTINGICMHLKWQQINATNCFYQQQQNENSLVVENKFNPILGRPCEHPGTKFKVLIAYFVEINQQSDSFALLTIIKTNKTKPLFSVFSIEYIFLPQGD